MRRSTQTASPDESSSFYEVVALGHNGSGKTTLITHRLMCATAEEADDPSKYHTIAKMKAPSVTGGIDISESIMSVSTDPLNSHGVSGSTSSRATSLQVGLTNHILIPVRFREASGSMKSFWPSLINKADVIMFVVAADSTSHLGQIINSIHTTLSSTRNKIILLVISKIDRLSSDPIPTSSLTKDIKGLPNLVDSISTSLFDADRIIVSHSSKSYPGGSKGKSVSESEETKGAPPNLGQEGLSFAKEGGQYPLDHLATPSDHLDELQSLLNSSLFDRSYSATDLRRSQLEMDLHLGLQSLESVVKMNGHTMEICKVSAISGEGCYDIYNIIGFYLLQKKGLKN